MVFYGLGNIVRGRPAGDFIIHFKEAQHNDIKRQQLDLVYEKYLTLYDALFGLTFDIDVPTKNYLYKTIRVSLEPITQLDSALQGDWFTQVVEGEGLETPDKQQRGDLKIIFKIIVPDIPKQSDRNTLKSLFLSSQRNMPSIGKNGPISKKMLHPNHNLKTT